MAPPQSGYSSTDSRWNLEMLVFVEGGKLENLEKNPRSEDENQQQTQPTNDTGTGNRTLGHIFGGRRVLSQLHHPCSPYSKFQFISFLSEIGLQEKSAYTLVRSIGNRLNVEYNMKQDEYCDYF